MSTRAGVPAGDPVGVKFGSPHVVDHGPENIRSPDGALYMVAGAIYGPLSVCVVSAAHDGSHDGAASAHFGLTLCEFVRTGGCLNGKATENCTWISGDGLFLARAKGFGATDPGSLNDAKNWEFWGGKTAGWVKEVAGAEPVRFERCFPRGLSRVFSAEVGVEWAGVYVARSGGCGDCDVAPDVEEVSLLHHGPDYTRL